MDTIERPTTTGIGAGHVAVVAIGAFVLYALIGGLEGTGRHFVELGALRIVLFGALSAFALATGAQRQRLGRAGLVIAGLAAVTYLAGGIGAVATDGWSFDVLDPDLDIEPPWYAYVIGLSAILFALGTVLVGIAGRSGGWLRWAVILGGAVLPVAFVLDPVLGPAGAHALWLAPWMALAVGLIASPERSPSSGSQSAEAR